MVAFALAASVGAICSSRRKGAVRPLRAIDDVPSDRRMIENPVSTLVMLFVLGIVSLVLVLPLFCAYSFFSLCVVAYVLVVICRLAAGLAPEPSQTRAR